MSPLLPLGAGRDGDAAQLWTWAAQGQASGFSPEFLPLLPRQEFCLLVGFFF